MGRVDSGTHSTHVEPMIVTESERWEEGWEDGLVGAWSALVVALTGRGALELGG